MREAFQAAKGIRAAVLGFEYYPPLEAFGKAALAWHAEFFGEFGIYSGYRFDFHRLSIRRDKIHCDRRCSPAGHFWLICHFVLFLRPFAEGLEGVRAHEMLAFDRALIII